MDTRDPVGYGSYWISSGRETELHRCDFAAGSMSHAGGVQPGSTERNSVDRFTVLRTGHIDLRARERHVIVVAPNDKHRSVFE